MRAGELRRWALLLIYDVEEMIRDYYDRDFDDTGFMSADRPSTMVRWSSIVRVAYCIEFHLVDFDSAHFWAFQTTIWDFSPRVEINAVTETISFSKEIRRRFGDAEIPEMRKWRDSTSFLIRTYVIYPAVLQKISSRV